MDSGVDGEYRYRPAWWLPGGHAQTIWGKFARRRPLLPYVREILPTPDGDAIETLTISTTPTAPRVLLLHGLEGTIDSHYVGGIMSAAVARGWNATVMFFRGCGSVPNTAPRFYHSGETTDVALIYETLRDRWSGARWFTVGVSLGANVMLKWLGEQGAACTVAGAVAISTPFDLEAGTQAISTGFSRVYDRNFFGTLSRKALAKLDRYPGLFDRERLLRARTVYEFDDAVTAPVHGFANAHDYYSKSSSVGFLSRIQVPTLLLSASDDPFLMPSVLPQVRQIARGNPALTLQIEPRGGHVGFVGGTWPWSATYYAENRAMRFLSQAGGR